VFQRAGSEQADEQADEQRDEQAGQQADERCGAPYSSGRARIATVLPWLVLAGALGALVALVVVGAAWPPMLPLAILAVVLAVSTNRDVLFPGEYAASADVAVLVAAVVAFRGQGALVGPLMLGLLAGVLDIVHWQQRSFVRMAWNSGERGLAALGAAGAFAAAAHGVGASPAALAMAALAAAAAGTAVDAALSVGQFVAHGGTVRDGARAVIEIDALVLPLACAGAASGFLAGAVGWWAILPPTLALGLVPELVQARARVPRTWCATRCSQSRSRRSRAWWFRSSRFPTTHGRRAPRRRGAGRGGTGRGARTSVPVALGLAVVAAAFTVTASHALFAGLLVGATATASSWWCTRAGGRARTISAVALAAIGGAASGAVVGEVDGLTVPAVLGAVAAVAVFAAVALVAQDSGWRTREAMVPVWAAPIVAMVVGPGIVVATAQRRSAAGPRAALSAVALVWCGAAPWRAGCLAPARSLAAGAAARCSRAAVPAPLRRGRRGRRQRCRTCG
jgi:hypothetical protein